MQDHLLEKEALVKQFGLTVQPHVVVICEDIEQLDTIDGSVAYAVIQSNLFYETPSVIAACDACFKAFYVMNVEYPASAKSAWTFVQHAVFEIGDSERHGLKAIELLTEVRKK